MLGGSTPRADLLNFAAEAIRFHLATKRKLNEGFYLGPPQYSLERQAFETWPLDAAMADGGWMILEYELDQIQPEINIGRQHMYQMDFASESRVYAAESDSTLAESDRVFRSLDWLSASQRNDQMRRTTRGREQNDYYDME